MNNAHNSLPALLTIKEVTQILGISRSTLYAGIHSGIYPQPVMVGARSPRFHRDAIGAFAQNGCMPPKKK